MNNIARKAGYYLVIFETNFEMVTKFWFSNQIYTL